MAIKALDAQEIARELVRLPGWSGDEHALKRQLKFRDFTDAMRFMQACIPEIDRLNHHPEWTNAYNTVDILLTTFDAGKRVTQLDVQLASALNQILEQRGGEFGLVAEAEAAKDADKHR